MEVEGGRREWSTALMGRDSRTLVEQSLMTNATSRLADEGQTGRVTGHFRGFYGGHIPSASPLPPADR